MRLILLFLCSLCFYSCFNTNETGEKEDETIVIDTIKTSITYQSFDVFESISLLSDGFIIPEAVFNPDYTTTIYRKFSYDMDTLWDFELDNFSTGSFYELKSGELIYIYNPENDGSIDDRAFFVKKLTSDGQEIWSKTVLADNKPIVINELLVYFDSSTVNIMDSDGNNYSIYIPIDMQKYKEKTVVDIIDSSLIINCDTYFSDPPISLLFRMSYAGEIIWQNDSIGIDLDYPNYHRNSVDRIEYTGNHVTHQGPLTVDISFETGKETKIWSKDTAYISCVYKDQSGYSVTCALDKYDSDRRYKVYVVKRDREKVLSQLTMGKNPDYFDIHAIKDMGDGSYLLSVNYAYNEDYKTILFKSDLSSYSYLDSIPLPQSLPSIRNAAKNEHYRKLINKRKRIINNRF